MYHLEILEIGKCTNDKLIIFSRAHYSYINQIFGDITVREIIQEIYKKEGTLQSVEETQGPFAGTWHHTFELNGIETCSVNEAYQNIDVDVNDTLCQSYSLMNYLQIPFNKTSSEYATIEQKKEKQMSMITAYRDLLSNPEFTKTFSQVIYPKNNKLWSDTVDYTHPFYIIQRYKKASKIILNIKRVLKIWEDYGWQYFVGNGTCIEPTAGGGGRKSMKKRKSKKSVKSKKTKVY